MNDNTISVDVLIIGAGPAGLATAIRLAQQSPNLSICILEKGSEVGAHILSGAVLETKALTELIPDWSTRNAPLHTPVTQDRFFFLTEKKAWRLPTPSLLHNKGNYIISLGHLCRWLADYAQSLGIEIYPSTPAVALLYDEQDAVCGVKTGDFGIGKDGKPTERYQPGMEIFAKQTILAEGCRGSLSKIAMARYQLTAQSQPQTYGIGLKEIWEVQPQHHQQGLVIHTVGWPLDHQTYGGSFIYHAANQQVNIGLIVGLDYPNPYLNPYEELQRLKTHPLLRSLLVGGRCISYGSKALVEGGWQALPQMHFPGGLLVGDSAGMVNIGKIKGIHNALRSGMIAAEHIIKHLQTPSSQSITSYTPAIKTSSIGKELYQVRNIRPAFHYGLFAGMGYAALEMVIFKGHEPWDWSHHPDHLQLRQASQCQPIAYSKADSMVTFPKLTALSLSNVFHEENQPCHLVLADKNVPIDVNLKYYDAPEQRYCPANVYEIVTDKDGKARLQINGSNCLHCKSCDIKDPTQNITWQPPEGGGGPNYSGM